MDAKAEIVNKGKDDFIFFESALGITGEVLTGANENQKLFYEWNGGQNGSLFMDFFGKIIDLSRKNFLESRPLFTTLPN